jgi:hypothetical protein
MARASRRFRFAGRLLRPIDKRDLINAKDVDPEVLKAYGQLYGEAGRFSDALDFFLCAGDTDGLTEIKTRAVEAGDSFLLHRLEASGAIRVEREDWLRLAEGAERLGKGAVAETARARGAEPAPPAQPSPGPDQPAARPAEGDQARRKG